MLNDIESKTISFAQATGIMAVVIGHFYFQPFDVMQPYVFHMPLFFFLGGLLLSINNGLALKLKKTITKHGWYLIKGYTITGVISIFLVSYFGVEKRKPFADSIISTIELIVKSNFGNNSLFVVGWFLLAYMLSSLACILLVAVIDKRKFKNAFIFIFILIFFYFGMLYFPSLHVDRSHYIANLLSQICTASGFILTGYLLRKHWFRILRVDVMVGLFFIMLVMKNQGLLQGLNIAWSEYPSGILLSILTSLSGIYVIFVLCYSLANIRGHYSIILFISKNTKSIMTYHILSFFIVDLVFYLIGKYDITTSATYSHYKNINTWPIYILSGLTLPLLAVYIYEVSLRFLFKKNLTPHQS